MKPKFGAKPTGKTLSPLGPKLETIACGIADEMISGVAILKGELSIQDKCNVLKTLSGYYGMVNKVEPPEELGGAFDGFRKKSAESPDGEGNPGRTGRASFGGTVIKLTGRASDGDAGDAAEASEDD